MKIHSVKFNFIMNFIMSASSIVFPLITFPYISRVLMATGNGKVATASAVITYFNMFASLGIPNNVSIQPVLDQYQVYFPAGYDYRALLQEGCLLK